MSHLSINEKILKALDLDPTWVIAATIHLRVGSYPEVDVTYVLPDSLNEGEIEEAMESYQIVSVCDEVFKLKRIKGDDGS